MKQILFLFTLSVLMTTQTLAQGTDKRPEMQRELDMFGEEITKMFDELKQALGEARYYMDTEMNMEKLDEEGTMNIMGDTIDIGIMYDFMAETFKQFPEQMRPTDEMLEEMKKSTKELPDMLLRSKNFFNDEEFDGIFGDLFKGWEEIVPIEPERDENGDIIPRKREYKTPKKDTKKKRKTTKI